MRILTFDYASIIDKKAGTTNRSLDEGLLLGNRSIGLGKIYFSTSFGSYS